jgi:carboxymethylenebutenolidase
METMTARSSPSHVTVGTGATGREPLRAFYCDIFIPQMPPDIKLQLLSRTVGQRRVIDEFVVRFTHTVQMDWFTIARNGRSERVAMEEQNFPR